MLQNNKRFKALIIIFFLQFFATAFISFSHERVAVTGKVYQFKIKGYDPVDPLRGRYLEFVMSTDQITSDLGDYTGKCYITITKNSEGSAYFDEAYKERPKDKDYIIGKKYGPNSYETPFSKYYVNEAIALKAETLFRENQETSYVTVRVRSGKGIIEGLYVGDKLIDNYFK